MANKMTAQDLVDNLRAAGFDGALIEEYLCCWKDGETGRQLELLSAKRANLLEHVHQEEKKIECLDYLVYLIGKGQVTASR